MHGSELQVAYQGVPGVYSEAVTRKAYPNCEAIPCDQFEVAFQAVELWIADRAVLPIENSLSSSIHWNYGLLLWHRLHIIGEVQLLVHHCLLALSSVRKEYLTRVISHPQALAQCELTLTKLDLNVAWEASPYLALNGLSATDRCLCLN
jgi:arogenate/prephenate dehydratase